MTLVNNGIESRLNEAISAGKPFGLVLLRLGNAYLRDEKSRQDAEYRITEIIRGISVPSIADAKQVSFEVIAHKNNSYYLLPRQAGLGDCWILRQELETQLLNAGYCDVEIMHREYHPEDSPGTPESIVRQLELARC